MGTPEFPDLGKHCAAIDCNQLDFLPFTCDVCKQVFCLDHRSYSKHQCPDAKHRDVTVLVCPLCAKAIRLIPDEDPNLAFDLHVRSACDPSNYERVHKKPRCPVRGCREMLTFSNKVVCRDCKKEVCLKHRFGPDHSCTGGPIKNPSSRASNEGTWQFMQSFIGGSTTGQGAKASSNASLSSSKSSGFKASAEAGINKLGNLTTSILNSIGGSSSSSSSTSSSSSHKGIPKDATSVSREVCPQCGAKFLNVSLLIQHVEAAHKTNQPLAFEDIVDLCPKCGKGFRDPISLVNHVETDHGGSSSRR